ncbi:hypothetical protein CKO17_17200, partial [Marichromatium gracile]|nr:hypothetical protein [Marichromatium gracile]
MEQGRGGDEVDALYETALAHQRAGRDQVAEPLYLALLALAPRHRDAHLQLARLRLGRGDADMAITGLRQLLESSADDAAALHLLAQAQQALGHVDNAAGLDSPGAPIGSSGGGVQNTDIGRDWEAGLALFQRGRFVEARARFVAALRAAPDSEHLLNALGNVARALGELDAAEEYYRRALIRCPHEPIFLNNLGLVLCDRGDHGAAHAHFMRALRARPDYAGAWINVGLNLQREDRLDEAERCYRRALELVPNLAQGYANLGALMALRGREQEAEALLRHALVLAPGLAEAHDDLGLVLSTLGRDEAAIACFQIALRLQPQYAQTYSDLGNAQARLGRLDEALINLERACALAPRDAALHSNRANVLKDLGRLDEAIAAFEQARALDLDLIQAESGLLFTLNYHPDLPAESIYAAYRDYNRRHGEPARVHWRAHGNDSN